jgi:8-oxo-dGTP pyrophosphatase MutT (NUDIX family)
MQRNRILQQIQAVLSENEGGSFCFLCGAPDPQVEETAQGEVFVCRVEGHRSPRAYLFDGKARYWFEDGKLVHVAAGAIVRHPVGEAHQTLLFLRRKFPFLYTIPAGHVELGADPKEEMRREVFEEAGLTVETVERLWPDEDLRLVDACRRGADVHQWYAYQVTASGAARLSDEGRIIGWYSDQEIRALAAAQQLTAPTHALLARLGVVDREAR